MLLLLDNFEHVAAAAAVVSDLVARCPRLKVLLTSRAALRFRSEHEYPVSPLPPPAVTPRLSVYALAANPAVDLFLRRAQAVKPEFALTHGQRCRGRRRSASGWTGCRSPWSWPHPGSGS